MCTIINLEKMKTWYYKKQNLFSLKECILSMAYIDAVYAVISTVLFITLSFTSDLLKQGFTSFFVFQNFEDSTFDTKQYYANVLFEALFLGTIFAWAFIQLICAYMLRNGVLKSEKSLLCIWWFWYWLVVTVLHTALIIYDLSIDGLLTQCAKITIPGVIYKIVELCIVRRYLNQLNVKKPVSELTLRRISKSGVVHA